MSDAFGIGQAIKGAAEIYLRAARQSGRTTAMVESLKPGDCVCVLSHKDARMVQEMCKERGFEIDVEVVNPKEPNKVFDKCSKQGRYIFDHRWVEQFYLNALDRVAEEISFLQKQKSGYGQPHLETKKKAGPMAFNFYDRNFRGQR